jgi:hypothetical protein
LLTEALWTSIEIQGFIPLLFALPIVSLYFANEDPEQASFVYAQIQHASFLAKAPLFEAIAYQYLPDEAKELPAVADPLPEDFDLRQRLWAAASNVLSSWIQVWMEEPPSNQKVDPQKSKMIVGPSHDPD